MCIVSLSVVLLFIKLLTYRPVSVCPPQTLLSRNVGLQHLMYISGCMTVDNMVCSFPFIFDGIIYNTCTLAGHNTAWCATSVDNEGNYYGPWGDCGSNCPPGKFQNNCLVIPRQLFSQS